MWSMVRPASYRSVKGVRPVSPSSVAAPTKRSAPALATVCTDTPRFANLETRSQALKQAIDPVSWNRIFGPSFDIVDEPHCTDAYGCEPPAVAVGDIVHVESFPCQRRGRLGGRAVGCDAFGEHAMQRRRACAVRWGEQAIARAHRESVRFPYRRAADNARVEEECVHEALDELQL